MSTVTVRIPMPLRSYTQGLADVQLSQGSVREILHQLGEHHPGLLDKILDEDGNLRSFVNVYVGEQNLKTMEGLDSVPREGSIISIIPAVAGGGS